MLAYTEDSWPYTYCSAWTGCSIITECKSGSVYIVYAKAAMLLMEILRVCSLTPLRVQHLHGLGTRFSALEINKEKKQRWLPSVIKTWSQCNSGTSLFNNASSIIYLRNTSPIKTYKNLIQIMNLIANDILMIATGYWLFLCQAISFPRGSINKSIKSMGGRSGSIKIQ